MHYSLAMKAATVPPIRVRPELRTEIEAVFLIRGIASLENAKLAGNYVDPDAVMEKLERKLTIANAGRPKVKAQRQRPQ